MSGLRAALLANPRCRESPLSGMLLTLPPALDMRAERMIAPPIRRAIAIAIARADAEQANTLALKAAAWAVLGCPAIRSIASPGLVQPWASGSSAGLGRAAILCLPITPGLLIQDFIDGEPTGGIGKPTMGSRIVELSACAEIAIATYYQIC